MAHILKVYHALSKICYTAINIIGAYSLAVLIIFIWFLIINLTDGSSTQYEPLAVAALPIILLLINGYLLIFWLVAKKWKNGLQKGGKTSEIILISVVLLLGLIPMIVYAVWLSVITVGVIMSFFQ